MAEPHLFDPLLLAVVASSLDGVIMIDIDGKVLEFNPAAEDMFGYRRADVLGKPIGDLIVPPHLRGAHEAGMTRYLSEGTPHVVGKRIEIDAMRANGSLFPVELAITEIVAGGRRLFSASLRDLSEQRAAEAALAQSNARLTAFLDYAPAAMYLKSKGGTYLVANEFMAAALGKPVNEIVGRHVEQILGPAALSQVAESDRRILETGAPYVSEERFDLPNGHRDTMAVRFPVRDSDGEITHLGGVFIDISERRKAEAEIERHREALHQAEKLTALGSLLAGVSHELNNPLSAVVGQSLMLEEDCAGTPHAARVAKIRTAAERCARIVQTFLAMARQKKPERNPVRLETIAMAAADLADYGIRTAGITLTTDYAADLPTITADKDQLHQVVVNLLINAQQAMQDQSEPREIRLRTAWGDTPGTVRFEISDSGPGVPADVRSRIFDPFFTTKAHAMGTGLGLSFSRGIVEAHGGSLRLTDLPGPGATFVIELPVNGEAAGDGDVAAATTGPSGGRALVVDDEPEVGETLGEMLTRQGFRVDVVTAAAEAQDLLAQGDYDVILSDLRMPGMDGPALYRWLCEQRPALAQRVGFVTGDTLGDAAATFLAKAGRPYLEKPFTPAGVRALLAALSEPQSV